MGNPLIVTGDRPVSSSSQLEERLQQQGFLPYYWPLLRYKAQEGGHLKECEQKIHEDDFSWSIFTSKRAVYCAQKQGLLEALKHVEVPFACVGAATVQALKRFHITAYIVAVDPSNAQHLVDIFPDYDGADSGQHILYLTSWAARNTLENGLTDKGWVVDRENLYGPEKNPAAQLQFCELEQFLGAEYGKKPSLLCTSSYAAELLCTDSSMSQSIDLRGQKIYCLGHQTHNVFRENGIESKILDVV